MQALGFTEHGDIKKMQILQVDKPEPGPGQALVKVCASALNHLDIWVRLGWPGLKLKMPHISGSDCAGEVVAVGEGVKSVVIGQPVVVYPGINRFRDNFTESGENCLSPGFEIIGEHMPGTHAEFVVAPAQNLLTIPENISFATAAAAGLVCLTSWRMLIKRAGLRLGENVLILGASGGVNCIALQLAKLAGCTVYATTSSDAKAAKLQALGADFVINYNDDPNWPHTIFNLTNNQGVDVVVDNVGAATLMASMRTLKNGGRIVIVGCTSGPKVELDLRYVFSKQVSLIGSTLGTYHDFRAVMNLVFAGKLRIPIHERIPLAQGIEGVALLERGEQFGKVVLIP